MYKIIVNHVKKEIFILNQNQWLEDPENDTIFEECFTYNEAEEKAKGYAKGMEFEFIN